MEREVGGGATELPALKDELECRDVYFGPVNGTKSFFCRQVRRGEMVRCDDPACAVIWFYVPCVAFHVGTYDETSWYCAGCRFNLGGLAWEKDITRAIYMAIERGGVVPDRESLVVMLRK